MDTRRSRYISFDLLPIRFSLELRLLPGIGLGSRSPCRRYLQIWWLCFCYQKVSYLPYSYKHLLLYLSAHEGILHIEVNSNIFPHNSISMELSWIVQIYVMAMIVDILNINSIEFTKSHRVSLESVRSFSLIEYALKAYAYDYNNFCNCNKNLLYYLKLASIDLPVAGR